MTSSSRRAFLRGLGLGAAAVSTLGLPTRGALADGPDGPGGPAILDAPHVSAASGVVNVPPKARKFLFVFNSGGWDPLTVFAPMFGHDGIDM